MKIIPFLFVIVLFCGCSNKEFENQISELERQLSEAKSQIDTCNFYNEQLKAEVLSLKDSIHNLSKSKIKPYVSGHKSDVIELTKEEVHDLSSAFSSVSKDFIEAIHPLYQKYKNDEFGRYAFSMLFSKGLISPIARADMTWYDKDHYALLGSTKKELDEVFSHSSAVSAQISLRMILYQKELTIKATNNLYGKEYEIDMKRFTE